MQEPARPEMDITYDAIVVLLRLTENTTFPFCIGLIDEAEWVASRTARGHFAMSPESNADHHELVRCSADEVRGVFRQVVRIATAPMFNSRCRNRGDETPAISPAATRFVIYLGKDVEVRTDPGPEEPTAPGVPRALSGMRPKAPSAKLA